MLVKTKHFGEIELSENKIISFDHGILGFEECRRFTLLYHSEEDRSEISWLQCLDEPDLALPVIHPFLIKNDYNPEIEDELLKPLGKVTEDNLVVLISITVPGDITKMSANLKAPFIINTQTRKGAQLIAENADYEIKYSIYDLLQANKSAKEGAAC